jgi:hypothetical protein
MRRTTPGLGASPTRTGGLTRWLGVLFLALTLAACGGGGDNSSSSSGSSGSSGSGSGSGGSTGGGSSSTSTATAQPSPTNGTNAVPISVNSGAAGFVNIPNVSVTVCAPNSSVCQTIDNIQLDTASFGLRLVSSAAQSVIGSLPNITSSSGGQLAECAGFADGYTWGTVRTADVRMGTEVAAGIPIQIIGDLSSSLAPTGLNGCPSGNDENTVAEIGANGILGVGPATYDCGTSCASTAQNSMYFSCSGSSCTGVITPRTQQVVNPVAKFAQDNNGVIVQLPPIADTGAASASGTLIFGIGTQSNNAISGVTKYGTDGFGDLSGSYKGTTYQTFFDTGSNGNFFQDTTFPLCSSTSSFYCPTSEQSLTASITGSEGNVATIPFALVSARTLTSGGGKYAFNSLGGQLGMSGFDFGLPFFYGRHVYVGFDLTGSTPFVAF